MVSLGYKTSAAKGTWALHLDVRGQRVELANGVEIQTSSDRLNRRILQALQDLREATEILEGVLRAKEGLFGAVDEFCMPLAANDTGYGA